MAIAPSIIHIIFIGPEATVSFPELPFTPRELAKLISLFSQREEIANILEYNPWGVSLEFKSQKLHNLIVIAEVMQELYLQGE